MENKPENNGSEKKELSRVKSDNNGPAAPRPRGEATKRKSFSLNEAVLSLDLALGRLKKSKLVAAGAEGGGRHAAHPSDMFMDLSHASTAAGVADPSMLSINLSHYELMRNLSRCTSNSDGALSGTTCNTFCASDATLKNEFLEKYFRSVDVWNRKHHDESSQSVQFRVPDK